MQKITLDEFRINYSDYKYLASILEQGGVLACPTDTGYNIIALSRERSLIKSLQKSFEKEKKLPVILYPNTSDMTKDLLVSQSVFKLIKKNTPSSCTFIVPIAPAFAAKIIHERKSEIAVRMPKEQILVELMKFCYPLISFGLVESESQEFAMDASDINSKINNLQIIDFERPVIVKPSTIINCCTWPIEVVRQGSYDLLD